MREYDLKKALSTGSYTRNSIKPQLLVAEDGEYRQGDILDANATMEVVNSTASNIDDKINDILGVDNGAVQELVGILSDSDTTTGILNELAKKANISDLETVAGDIPQVPTNVSAFTNDAGYLTQHQDISGKANSSDLSTVATSGSYNDLSNKPNLANVATSGSYEDLSNKPHIPEDPVQSDWTEDDTTDQAYIKNKPSLATVATTGDYTDLSNKPAIPAAQIQSDWAQDDNTQVDYIKNKPDLSTVATTGSYNDLTDKPTIPTKVSDLTNNQDFLQQPHSSNGHEYVEIGGIKWATMNVGASSETDKGLYFAWGETEGYRIYADDSQNTRDFSESEYKYAELDGSTYVYTKYNSTDGKSSLDIEDDAARANWGGNWRIPTRDEFSNLFVNCIATIVRDSNDSAIGFLFTDKTDSTKSIYFPGCRGRKDGVLHDRNFYNSLPIWTNQRYDLSDYSYDDIAWIVAAGYETTNGVDTPHPNSAETAFRYSGRPVRAILDEPTPSNTASKVAVTGDYNDLVNKPIIRVVNLTQNLANETTTISGVENSGKTEVVIYNNTTDESHFVIVSTINKTPTGKLLELIAPVGGYCEVSYINIGGVVFAKGLIVKNDDNNDSLYDDDGDWIIAEFDIDDITKETCLLGGLDSLSEYYGYHNIGAIVIDDVTVISKRERFAEIQSELDLHNYHVRPTHDWHFGRQFDSEGIYKIKYEYSPVQSYDSLQITGMFAGCSNLKTLYLPNIFTSLGAHTFSGCTNLKRLNSETDGVFNIPDSVTFFSNGCFSGCSNLTTINIPSSVINMGYYYQDLSTEGEHGGGYFSSCQNLTTINVDSNNTIYDSRNNCNAIIKTNDNRLIAGCKNTTIPSTVTEIYVCAFSGCKGMTSLTIPSNVLYIYDRAFNGSDLQELSLPSETEWIGVEAFKGCSSLKRINSNTDGVFNLLAFPKTLGGITSVHGVFEDTALTTLNVSSTATQELSNGYTQANVTYSERTTCNCQQNLTIFDYITVDQNNSVYDSRNNCNAVIKTSNNTLVIGCKNTTIPNTVTAIGYNAFAYCNELTELTIPNSVISIGDSAFIKQEAPWDETFNKINSDTAGVFNMPSGLLNIGSYAFTNRRGLQILNIPSGIETIGRYAFKGTLLKRVNSETDGIANIPSSITNISLSAFDSTLIQNVIFNSTTPPTIDSVVPADLSIYVPTESVELYKTALGDKSSQVHDVAELQS